MRRGAWRWAAGACVLGAGACAAQQATSPAAAPAARPSLAALIGDAACTADAQCRTVAVGARACGGPERYLAWSAARSDGAAIEAAAALDSRQAAAKGSTGGDAMLSTCQVVPDPGAYCAPQAATGSCRLRPPAPAGASTLR